MIVVKKQISSFQRKARITGSWIVLLKQRKQLAAKKKYFVISFTVQYYKII